MRYLTIFGMAALLVAFFFQCGGPGTPEPPPIEGPTEVIEPPTEQPTAPPPEPTATLTEAPAPAPVKLEFTGQGNEATDMFELVTGLLRSEYTHDGEMNFIVTLLDEQGEFQGILANEIGACEGSGAQGVDAGRYVLDVLADGNWSITLRQ